MRHISVCGALAAATLLVGCGDQVETGTIAWYRTPCEALTASLCTVMIDEAGAPTAFYAPIDGYTPTWGVEADVRYTIESSSGDPDAVGAYTIEHIDDTRTVAAGTPAVWRLSPTWDWFTADGDQLRILGIAVTCEAEVCADLLARDAAGAVFLVDIESTADAAAPVRAVAARAP